MVKEVFVLKIPECSSCGDVIPILEKIKTESHSSFCIKEADVTQDPALFEKYPLMAAPGIVIDGELVFMGPVSEEQLREKLS